jgi:hypothetical protein
MQTFRVYLPAEGDVEHWAEIRAVAELRAGDAKAVRRAAKIDVGGDDENTSISIGINDVMRDALLARVITAWSYDLPIPAGDVESLDKLSLEAYNALLLATDEHWSRVDFKRKAGASTNSNSSDSRAPSQANGHPPNLPAAASTP